MTDSEAAKKSVRCNVDEDHQQAWECYRRHAWEYFHHHACQRTTIFNFYFIACAILANAYFRAMADRATPRHGMVLSVLLVLLSIIFHLLDRRNAGLVEIAEAALRDLEKDLVALPDSICIFSIEANKTEAAKKQKKSFWPWKNYYGHAECFRRIFMTCGLLGILGFVNAAILWFRGMGG